ncbi:hypothetical protein K1T71_006106 [Dendrolimus kikuchii]|uniref:Uncharacterized protein n=1 Tax=Dendrolimus kikuchii TaxID=765133 RepID=A0ACC1D2Y9_9NEOP|nr:hypothetical protein K1T71_006106 [Dendrolimus kikuchii]
MASLRRFCFKYAQCIGIAVLLTFFGQILIALNFFPTITDNLLKQNGHVSFKTQEVGGISARKNSFGYDDEDLASNSKLAGKHGTHLRLEELDFNPACDINNREAISAVHRAKSQLCKQQIVNKTCLIQQGHFYPEALQNKCFNEEASYGQYLGCYVDEKKLRLLSGFYGVYVNTNSPKTCLDICVQAGFPFAGVQYGTECFCGEDAPPASSKVPNSSCDMKCPGDSTKICGGYFTMNVFETGLVKFVPRTPDSIINSKESVKIVFLLTLNGRALRQVHRLINVLYRSNHYFYIHVDKRQDYLHRKLSTLEKTIPNIKLATKRFATIWGGASLLKMLLTAMKEFIALGWNWDFVINLSESDFPIKSLESLENFLSVNKGLNFVKSHGREVQRFIKKQGLDKTFIECDTHMWRVGERKLPTGIIIDGGSDWIALSPDFVSYVVGKHDELLAGLDIIFQHTLLPAESFFHTVLRNSRFCKTYVDNNLHVTNWKRKLGCKCQYKHVVDWCGCSPNDFRTEDWPRIQNTQDRQLFFARKFEPIVNQEIINRVEKYIGFKDHHILPNIESYWQSIYNADDLTASTDDVILTHAMSILRHNAKILGVENCIVYSGEILEINSYSHEDTYKGNLILYKAVLQNDVSITMETWYKPKQHLEFKLKSKYLNSIKSFKVSSDYDQKETLFRNMANILGPLSDPVLLYQFAPNTDLKTDNLSVLWLDPAGMIADLNNIHIEENNLTNFLKPNLRPPLLPGTWKVGLFDGDGLLALTRFLITPLEYFSGKEISHQEVNIIHSGSQNSYKNFSHLKSVHIMPDQTDSALLQKIAHSNVKRITDDLREWIDTLSIDFYNVLGSCLSSSNISNDYMKCGNQKFDYCESTEWSSLTPDPKGNIGKINPVTGRLDRV